MSRVAPIITGILAGPRGEGRLDLSPAERAAGSQAEHQRSYDASVRLPALGDQAHCCGV
jgi:hypothetical protein